MKYVLITGGTSGIGYELARCFLSNNYKVIIMSSSTDRLEIARKKLEHEFKTSVKTYEQDLSEIGGAKKLYDKIKQDNINIEILINNAGYGLVGSTVEIDFELDEKLMILNVISLVELSKLFIADMFANKSGKILNISSIGAYQPVPNSSTYCASKSFVLSYSRAIRYEAKNKGVQVCTLCPGPTKTNFFNQEGLKTPFEAMSPERCATFAYKNLMKNKEVSVPGFTNVLKILLPTKIKMFFISRIKSSKNKI